MTRNGVVLRCNVGVSLCVRRIDFRRSVCVRVSPALPLHLPLPLSLLLPIPSPSPRSSSHSLLFSFYIITKSQLCSKKLEKNRCDDVCANMLHSIPHSPAFLHTFDVCICCIRYFKTRILCKRVSHTKGFYTELCVCVFIFLYISASEIFLRLSDFSFSIELHIFVNTVYIVDTAANSIMDACV